MRNPPQAESSIRYRRYRAPAEDGQALVEPGWLELRQQLVARSTTDSQQERSLSLSGVPLAQVQSEARRQLLHDAYAFTRSYCDVAAVSPESSEGPLVLSGHQPELYHPGVWFKNLALDALARKSQGVGVHLLIDSDLCRTPVVQVPTGSLQSPQQIAIPLDKAAPELPYEERSIHHPALLASFGDHVVNALNGLVEKPLAAGMTADLVAAAQRTENLGQALSQSRRLVEHRWGSRTLELPFSAVCDTSAFRHFVVSLLEDPALLHQAYNGALAEYRAAHRLRTPAQPLPNLRVEDGWWETPLWVWSGEDPRRRPLFTRHDKQGAHLSDLSGNQWTLPQLTVDCLQELRNQKVKLRSRALMTTLYCRLVLADLFLHGIGGAKYDEVTDDFARRYFGVTPPEHATLTATFKLPITRPTVSPAEGLLLTQRQRELRYHPEKFLPNPATEAALLIAEKQAAIEAIQQRGIDADRHRQIDRANVALQAFVDDQHQALLEARRQHANGLRAEAVLGSREYSFCLFPEEFLHAGFQRLLP